MDVLDERIVLRDECGVEFCPGFARDQREVVAQQIGRQQLLFGQNTQLDVRDGVAKHVREPPHGLLVQTLAIIGPAKRMGQ
ncbi:MAG: hypothetical protein WBM40_01255 [Thiohalocapsa sp.]